MPDPQFTIEPPATPQFTIEPPARPAKPGALSRLGTSAREAVGIPADPLQDIAGGVQFATEHPGEAAKQLALSPIESYKAAVSQQYDRMHDAYKRGDYGQALVHGLYYLLSPVGGANLGKAAEQIRTGDIAGATGTTLGTALPIVAGSPEVRAAAGTAANATRSAVATGLEKGAKPVSTVATIAGAAHELSEGRPWSAATIAALGKPGISKTMTSVADFIRPGENVKPLPKSFATIHDLTGFLNSPGIEGEAPAAAKTAGRPTPTTWGSATYEPIYLKAAKEALPNAGDKEVAAEAAKLQAHDEHVAGILKESSDALKAAAKPSPFQEAPKPEIPISMEGYYGEYSGKSNLPANKRQLASPTGSTAPVPKPKPEPAPPFSLGSMKNYYTGTLGEMGDKPKFGPGAANVTDPAFLESKALGSHADYLNGISEQGTTGSDVAEHNKGVVPFSKDEIQNHKVAAQLLSKYKTDPDFKNLADAARMYVHNHETIGDIDKISLGDQPFHMNPKLLTQEEHDLFGPVSEWPWDVDKGTTMLDGTKFGKGQISTHEGRQMVETLYSAIREAKERSAPLYRGVNADLENLKVGDNFNLALSSFSDRPRAAQGFGDTIFELKGPSKHVNVKPFNSMDEGEHLTQGRFEVTGDRTETVTRGPFYAGGKSVSEQKRYITIKQTGVH